MISRVGWLGGYILLARAVVSTSDTSLNLLPLFEVSTKVGLAQLAGALFWRLHR